ncbi:MAG: NAD(P) transhydrogenase subunit alpha, partial [Candidatus Omnitrophica bacterium]|nr:NAD(P) transhydrogenase subunit alpha [Candidatus Omnitrophota bacterium]
MNISIPKEIHPLETRVAVTPDTAGKLVKAGFTVRVEQNAGARASFIDADYQKAGAQIITDAQALWSEAGILAKIGLPTAAEIGLLSAGSIYIGFLNPLADPSLSAALAARQVTAFSMELIPRTSRAQSMDALSSQASISGYKSVLLAANTLGKYLPMLTTAAGTVPPAKILIIGVGVAGLQAIATARRLGAVVEAFDIRPEVKEQVLSLGAKFVEAKVAVDSNAGGGYAKEVSEDTKKLLQDALAERVAASDIVITTAQVPGKKAPVLVTAAMVARMKPGAVVIDL